MTATAGAARPARLATFCTCDGAACRPLLLIFRFLLCANAELTNLPYAGSTPSYAARRAPLAGA